MTVQTHAFRRLWRVLAALAVCLLPAVCCGQIAVEWWSSTEDLKEKLAPQPAAGFAPATGKEERAIEIDEGKRYQSILGLGSSLEHSTCYNLSLLPEPRREKTLESLVHPEKGIGMNLMRICIGTPDFTASPWYTYDDMPPGRKDPGLAHFSIEKDRAYVLPVLKSALRLNPKLKFIASPWSPPGWMKTSDRITGGRIDPKHFPDYAQYLVRFIEAYRAEGLDIHAITIQNEPEYFPDTYPTCGWTASQQRDFIRDHLGPAFRARQIQTLIWCFDHNFNNPGFPARILRDEKAAQYVDGSAFHLYEGKPSAMSKLREQFPEKHLYFTEGSTYGAEGGAQVISYLRNWSRSYNAWVTIIDHNLKPNPGPHDCDPTCIVLNSQTLELDYRYEYYMYGQFTKFVHAGAVRVASSESPKLPANVALQNPDGSMVLIVANSQDRPAEMRVRWRNRLLAVTLKPKSVSTFLWRGA